MEFFLHARNIGWRMVLPRQSDNSEIRGDALAGILDHQDLYNQCSNTRISLSRGTHGEKKVIQYRQSHSRIPKGCVFYLKLEIFDLHSLYFLLNFFRDSRLAGMRWLFLHISPFRSAARDNTLNFN